MAVSIASPIDLLRFVPFCFCWPAEPLLCVPHDVLRPFPQGTRRLLSLFKPADFSLGYIDPGHYISPGQGTEAVYPIVVP